MEAQLIQLFQLLAIDNQGYIVAAVGYTIVFVALVALYFLFFYIARLVIFFQKRQLKKEGRTENFSNEELTISGDVNAAISAAIYLFFNEIHDDESNVITIKKVSKTYSPWSSKIYGVQQFNR